MLLAAYVLIVLLTWVLVVLNIRAVVVQYELDHNRVRLYSHLCTLLIVGSFIIGIASSVVQRVIDSETYLNSDKNAPSGVIRR